MGKKKNRAARKKQRLQASRAQERGLPAVEPQKAPLKAPRDEVVRANAARRSIQDAHVKQVESEGIAPSEGMPMLAKVGLGAAAILVLVFGLSQYRKSEVEQAAMQEADVTLPVIPGEEGAATVIDQPMIEDPTEPEVEEIRVPSESREVVTEPGSEPGQRQTLEPSPANLPVNSEKSSTGSAARKPSSATTLASSAPAKKSMEAETKPAVAPAKPKTATPTKPKVPAPMTPKVIKPAAPTPKTPTSTAPVPTPPVTEPLAPTVAQPPAEPTQPSQPTNP